MWIWRNKIKTNLYNSTKSAFNGQQTRLFCRLIHADFPGSFAKHDHMADNFKKIHSVILTLMSVLSLFLFIEESMQCPFLSRQFYFLMDGYQMNKI